MSIAVQFGHEQWIKESSALIKRYTRSGVLNPRKLLDLITRFEAYIRVNQSPKGGFDENGVAITTPERAEFGLSPENLKRAREVILQLERILKEFRKRR